MLVFCPFYANELQFITKSVPKKLISDLREEWEKEIPFSSNWNCLKRKKLNPHLQKLDLKLLRTRLYKPKTRYSGILLKWTSVHLLYKTSLGIKMTKNLNWMTSRYCDLGFPSSLISLTPLEFRHKLSFLAPIHWKLGI